MWLHLSEDNVPALVNEQGETQYKVMVAVPCGEQVAEGFALDLALMMAYTTFVKPTMEVGLYFLKGTYLPRARAALVEKALERNDTHMLWLDSDMRFPKDTLLRLLAHERPIVGANYATRQAPILPTMRDMERSYLFDGSEHLLPVHSMGMGCLLTATDVFRQMDKPYFAIGYNKEQDDYAGEDAFFAMKAQKAGFQVLMDTPLSEAVRHVGTMEFTMDHARMTRDAALAQQQTHAETV